MATSWPVMAAVVAGWPAGVASAWCVRPFAGQKAPAPVLAGACALGFVWAALVVRGPLILAVSFALAWALISLAAIDLACLRLPDVFTLPLIAGGLLVAVPLGWSALALSLAGAASGYLIMVAVRFIWRRWRGREALGLGDAKLLAAAGAWLGPERLPAVLLTASLATLAWAGVRAVARQGGWQRELAFGPGLALAFWLAWLYGLTPAAA